MTENSQPVKRGRGRPRKYSLDGERVCRVCGISKPVEEFPPNYTDAKGYVTTVNACRVCKTAEQRLSTYSITPEQYQSMLADQKNACAICLEPFNGDPQIDHCHDSLRVRGLLCRRCNIGLGQFKDDVTILSRAINYLHSGTC